MQNLDLSRFGLPQTVGDVRARAARALLTRAKGGLPDLAVIASAAPIVGQLGSRPARRPAELRERPEPAPLSAGADFDSAARALVRSARFPPPRRSGHVVSFDYVPD